MMSIYNKTQPPGGAGGARERLYTFSRVMHLLKEILTKLLYSKSTQNQHRRTVNGHRPCLSDEVKYPT